MILFLQFNKLNYTEIFWIYTIAAIANVVLEIPTGIAADLIGKKKTIIYSRIFIFLSFIMFGFSNNFIQFVIAQLLLVISDSLKSGTDVAFIYDYLKQKEPKISYSEIKGKQKFWARLSEAVAAPIGTFIYSLTNNFNIIFFIAAIPALIHIFLVLFWPNIKEYKHKGNLLEESIQHTKKSFLDILREKNLFNIAMNIGIYVSVVAAASKFLQPYMIDANVPLESFGIIYSVSFILTALAVRYSYIFEKKFSKAGIINFLSLFSVIPLLILGLKFVSVFGVLLFFLLIIGENIRSPISTNLFHDYVDSRRRATLGSILMMFRNIGKAILLPFFGYLADYLKGGFYPVLLIMAFVMFVNWISFIVKDKSSNKFIKK
jgi:MFS family permease